MKLDSHPVDAEYNVSVISDDDVKEIRAKYVRHSREFGSRGLAKMYNVHDSTIRLIVSGKTWRHL